MTSPMFGLPTIDELRGIYHPSINVRGLSKGSAITWHVTLIIPTDRN
jgi:hypothetical protein